MISLQVRPIDLRCSMQDPDELPGFMRTGSAVLVEGKQQFLGQILEFVSGDGLDKTLRITQVSILLLRRMLHEVSASLPDNTVAKCRCKT